MLGYLQYNYTLVAFNHEDGNVEFVLTRYLKISFYKNISKIINYYIES